MFALVIALKPESSSGVAGLMQPAAVATVR